MINRRALVLACGSLLAPLAAGAQPAGKVCRVGWLGFRAYGTPYDERLHTAFVQRLRELGFTEGRNLVFEWRYAEGKMERYAEFAAEMVKLKADVVVSVSPAATRALMSASRTLPIVAFAVVDPVGSGLVASLARPGGQLTGMTTFPADMVPKRLELFRAALPSARRIAFATAYSGDLRPHGNADVVGAVQAAQDEAARALGVKLLRIDVNTAGAFEQAAIVLRRERPDALFIGGNPVNQALQREWLALAAELRLPTFGPYRGFGAMFSYGPDFIATIQKVAEYVAKILNGASPGDLPMEQPMKFEFVIDLKMAKAFGVTIPQAVLLRADEVIE